MLCCAGDDLNRQYVDPDEIKHPTIYHTKKLVESLVSVGDVSCVMIEIL
jgi:hypothetical protein